MMYTMLGMSDNLKDRDSGAEQPIRAAEARKDETYEPEESARTSMAQNGAGIECRDSDPSLDPTCRATFREEQATFFEEMDLHYRRKMISIAIHDRIRPEDVEDLFQQLCLNLFNCKTLPGLGGLGWGGDLSAERWAFAYTCWKNLIFNRLRQQNRHPDQLDPDFDPPALPAPDPIEMQQREIEIQQLRDRYSECLPCLTTVRRRAIEGRREGLPYAKISEKLQDEENIEIAAVRLAGEYRRAVQAIGTCIRNNGNNRCQMRCEKAGR